MIEIKEHPEGFLLPVRAQPEARKEGVVGVHCGMLKLAVTAPADDGRANQALLELLRDVLALKRSHVELLGGHKSRSKLFLIRGLNKAQLLARIEIVLSNS